MQLAPRCSASPTNLSTPRSRAMPTPNVPSQVLDPAPARPGSIWRPFRRALTILIPFVALASGWGWVLQQHAALWQGMDSKLIDRYAADGVRPSGEHSAPDAGTNLERLIALCPRPSIHRDRSRPWLPTASCLVQSPLVNDTSLRAVESNYWLEQLGRQRDWLKAWLAAESAQRVSLHDALADQWHHVRTHPYGPLQAAPKAVRRLRESAGSITPDRPGQPAKAEADPTVTQSLRALLRRTEVQLVQWDRRAPLGDEGLRALALAAAGLQPVWDFGQWPEAITLRTDPQSLAAVRRALQRSQSTQAGGFDLRVIQAVPSGLALASLVGAGLILGVGLLPTFRAQRDRALLSAAALVTMGLLLAVGALLLTDVSLVGDDTLRYLVHRQFVATELAGQSWAWLLIWRDEAGRPIAAVWWPLLLWALSWAAACMMTRRPAGASGLQGPGPLPMTLIAIGGALAALAIGGMGTRALANEWMLALSAVGVAALLATHANITQATGKWPRYATWALLAWLTLAVAGTLAMGDLGHALVIMMLSGFTALLVGAQWLRITVMALSTALVLSLLASHVQGEPAGLLAMLQHHVLPPHAQARVSAVFNRFGADASDLARVHWLVRATPAEGWGPGRVPWSGLIDEGRSTALPIQGPSDYAPAMLAALWGPGTALLWIGLLSAVLMLGAGIGLRTAWKAQTSGWHRMGAAAGALGCLMAWAKIGLSVGGVAGVLPLTGLPVAWIGYGPVAGLAALCWLLLALAPGRPSASVGHAVNQWSLRRADLPPLAVHSSEAWAEPVRFSTPGTSLGSDAAHGPRERADGLALGAVAAAGLVLLSAWIAWTLTGDAKAEIHVAERRLALASAMARSLAVSPTAADAVPERTFVARDGLCPALVNAVQAWNAAHTQRFRVSAASDIATAGSREADAGPLRVERLWNHLAHRPEWSCSDAARQVGAWRTASGMQRVLGSTPAPWRLTDIGSTPALSPRSSATWPGPSVNDFATSNVWQGLPGCIVDASSPPVPDCSGAQSTTRPRAAHDTALAALQVAGLTEPALVAALAPRLRGALVESTHTGRWGPHSVAQGPSLQWTVETDLQQWAQKIADCSTSLLRAELCSDSWPQDASWRSQWDPSAPRGTAGTPLRSGALGVVVLDVDRGGIVAMAGALSECSASALQRTGPRDPQGRSPAWIDGAPCAAWPDRRSAWLQDQPVALWQVPPGSAIKPLALIAAHTGSPWTETRRALWKTVLARSEDRHTVQQAAMAAGRNYVRILDSALGLESTPALSSAVPSHADLLRGQASEAARRNTWPVSWLHGREGLDVPSMDFQTAEKIRREKLSGVDVDRRHGPEVMRDFLAARRWADTALGGADLRISALGLAHAWAAIDRRARGHDRMVIPHLLRETGLEPAQRDLRAISVAAAREALALAAAVTSAKDGGTAAGACRVVMNGCPLTGWPGLSGKTGTSDFLIEENGAWVKPGQQLPAKLFGGVFTAADGRRLAVGVMVLRTRQGTTLELRGSAAAEAALSIVRRTAGPPTLETRSNPSTGRAPAVLPAP